MAEVTRKKSVAFAEDETTIDGDGQIHKTLSPTRDENGDSTAIHHTAPHTNGENAVDEATAAFDDLALAKKKKKSTKKPKEESKEKEGEAEAPADGDELDLTAMKKKKKSKKPKSDADDFEKKLAKAGAAGEEEETPEAAPVEEVAQEGDMDTGTGIWAHDATQAINYDLLLNRFFTMLNSHNPDLMSGSKASRIPPPQCLREGNKKTIFANLAEIARRVNRSDEHVAQFLFAEMGTTGSVAADRRLVIRGKFQGKQIEQVLRRYISEYVTCRTCKSGRTNLVRGENRLYFIECQQCNSRRSVSNIKSGFRGQVGKRRRQQQG